MPDRESDFQSFEEYDFKPPPYLPDIANLHAYDLVNHRDVPLRVDSGKNLCVWAAPLKYKKMRPRLLYTTPQKLLSGEPDEELYLVGIDVINTTPVDTSLKLYYVPEDAEPSDYLVFANCGGLVPAWGLWSWRGALVVESDAALWGVAGRSSSLRAVFSVRYGRGRAR